MEIEIIFLKMSQYHEDDEFVDKGGGAGRVVEMQRSDFVRHVMDNNYDIATTVTTVVFLFFPFFLSFFLFFLFSFFIIIDPNDNPGILELLLTIELAWLLLNHARGKR